MKNLKNSLFVVRGMIGLCLSMILGGIQAQTDLSLADAVALGLKNNYDIRIADMNAEIAENNHHAGTAGLLPSLNFNINNSAFRSGSPAAFTASRLNTSMGPQLSWTLFDGFRAQTTMDRLELLEEQSVGQAAIVVENTIQAIVLAYYNVLLTQEQERVFLEVLEASRERLKYEEFRKEIGATSTFDMIQFRSGALTDSANYVSQQLSYRNALRNLNLLMAMPIERNWKLTDPIQETFDKYTLEDLEEKMLASNRNLRNQYITNHILRQDIRLARANLYPVVGATGAVTYGAGRIERSFGAEPIQTFSAFDFTAGLSVSFNLFNGGNVRRQIENARINEQIGHVQENQLKETLANDLQVAFDNYEVRREILNIQNAAISNARTNLDLATERLSNGLINSLDFRTIQNQYRNTQLSRIRALFDLIESETELIRLTGGLVRTE